MCIDRHKQSIPDKGYDHKIMHGMLIQNLRSGSQIDIDLFKENQKGTQSNPNSELHHCQGVILKSNTLLVDSGLAAPSTVESIMTQGAYQ